MKLGRKILLITISVSFVSLLISSVILVTNFKKNYTEALITGTYGLGHSLNSIVSELLSLGLPLDSFTGMDKKCRQLLENNPHITYVGVTDTSGKVLYNGDPALVGRLFKDEVMKRGIASTKPITQRYRRFDGLDYYDVTIPIIDSTNSRLGQIRLGFPTSVVNDKVMAALLQVIINFSLSFIVIAILINYFISRFVSRPVIKISEHARKIAEGNYDVKLEVTAGDEVGTLSTSINQLSTQVKQKTRDLEDANTELELKLVKQREDEDERLSLERQLLHVQKLESLGVLAGGIAHDFNNILTSIIGNAELALMRIHPESPAIDNLHSIEKAAARAADLAKQMLAYSGKGKFFIGNHDINGLLEEMLHILQVSISKKAVLRLNLTTPLPPVEADATQIRQIIMNLVINASEAIGDKSGVIAITTGCMDCDRSYLKDVWLDENINDGLYVFIEIADTGCGMDKETMAKLFDPFFTTKFTGRGLGMAAVLGIVRGHKGAVKVYSEPGKGSTFKILLPASGKPAEIFNYDTRDGNWRGSGTVLLVDDEETVRGIGAEMLKELGFNVVTANDGREAVEAYKAGTDFSFVILDLTMPHMDGEQCFRELRMLNPDVKVIMSSGFSELEVTQKFAGKGLAGFIQKPYKLSVLREGIMKLYPADNQLSGEKSQT